MKSNEMSGIIFAFVIVIILPRLEALSADSAQPSIDQKMTTRLSQQDQHQPTTTLMTNNNNNNNPNTNNGRRQMSCYVCSTMDYENPQENSCKSMPKPPRQATGPLYQQPASASHHPSSMSFPHQTTTTTTTSTTTTTTTAVATSASSSLDGDDLHTTSPPSMMGGSSMPYEDATQFDPTTMVTTDQQLSSLNNNNNNNSNDGGNKNNITMLSQHHNNHHQHHHQQQQQHSSSLSPISYQQHRLPQNTVIKKRPCLEDENFCSIVSVVRIEFVNDTLLQRFWAMERNCSRSCNTGCMLIGERVRLRVCSQCCRTPDCNTGSGATTTFSSTRGQLYNLILILSSSLMLLKPALRVQSS